MLTPTQYESRRNELIQLLDEASTLEIPEEFGSELKATAKKCKEDQFEIALVGEFQGGKSTTFNALCDGRDISPRGLRGGGLKTSAAVITAQNISDNESKNGYSEWAEVTFKTPRVLAYGMFDCLKGSLITSQTFRRLVNKSDEEFIQDMSTSDGFANIVNLTRIDQRECIKSALHELWNRWNENRSAVTDEQLDLLRIATLQLRYFDSPEYRELIMRSVLPIVNFQKLVAFPKDWTIRWGDGENAKFTLEECAFVFIDKVLVRLHSRNLERLGCRITDCPGLFANAYDTAVAKETIRNADGIWYLVNGEKQIGEKDLKILRTIKSLGMLGKTNATFNLKGSHEQKMEEIFPATKSVLQNAGLDVELFPYNARFAFLATQGDLLVNHPGCFSDLDRSCMLVDAKEENNPTADPKKMWAKMVRRVGSTTELANVEDITGLDTESVAVVRKESRLDDILGTVERSVVAKKSRSILIDKGSTRAAKALVKYEGVLKATESAAAAKENEWREKVEAATHQLQDFINRAKKTMSRSALLSGKESLSEQMAGEFIQATIDEEFLDNAAAMTIYVLETVGKDFYATHASMEAAIIQNLSPIIGDLFKDAVARAAESWKTSNHSRSLSELNRRSRNLCDELHDLWEDKHLDSDQFFDGFTPPDINEDDVRERCLEVTKDIFMGESALAVIAEEGRRGIFTVILKEILLPFILGALGGVICFPLATAVIIGKAIWDATRSQEELEERAIQKLQKKVEELSPRVKSELQKAFNSGEFRARAVGPLIEKFAISQDVIIAKIQDSLDKLSDDFRESRCRQPEEMFSKSAAERKAIAEANRKIRTERIQPLRERIEAFEATVLKELA